MRVVGRGLASIAADDTVLDAWFPLAGISADGAGSGDGATGVEAAPSVGWGAETDVRRVRGDVVTVEIDTQEAPASTADAYLRLHLLSHRLVAPRTIELTGIFGLLPNNAWTNVGPVPPSDVDGVRARIFATGQRLQVFGLDKFPRMTDYVTPPGVRIADADRVRLGAHLAAGTTVMHEGYCNFNAGTLGTSMVEGRISQGVIVGNGSDIGGGASIMGTLSGGGTEQITIGERCLLGAESGLGISLGDECVVEAGLYVTAGTQVRLPNGEVVKARELSGVSGLLFRRHSQTGAVEAHPRASGPGAVKWAGLNTALHAND